MFVDFFIYFFDDDAAVFTSTRRIFFYDVTRDSTSTTSRCFFSTTWYASVLQYLLYAGHRGATQKLQSIGPSLKKPKQNLKVANENRPIISYTLTMFVIKIKIIAELNDHRSPLCPSVSVIVSLTSD